MILSKCRRPHHVDAGARSRDGLTSGPSISFRNEQQTRPSYEDIFPCANPTSPMYSDYCERLRTYRNWPKGQVMKPERLADAGLFFLGDRDRSKCFYCNGGLQNWVQGDDPMEEHAKYFPQCEYVLARMGLDYVVELNARFPNLKRPTISASTPQTNHHEPQRRLGPAQNDSAVRLPTGNMQHTNLPQVQADDCILGHNQIHHLASEAEKFGYDKNTIKKVVSSKLQKSGAYHDSLTELIEDLIQNEQGELLGSNLMKIEYTGMPTVPAVTVGKPSDVTKSCNNNASNSLREQLQSAIDETLCKSCHKRSRDCVFLDCGHLCCCYECGESKSTCVICNARITKVIKIFKM